METTCTAGMRTSTLHCCIIPYHNIGMLSVQHVSGKACLLHCQSCSARAANEAEATVAPVLDVSTSTATNQTTMFKENHAEQQQHTQQVPQRLQEV